MRHYPITVLSFTEDEVKKIVRNFVIEKLKYQEKCLGKTTINLTTCPDNYIISLLKPCFDNLTIEINLPDYIQDNFKSAA